MGCGGGEPAGQTCPCCLLSALCAAAMLVCRLGADSTQPSHKHVASCPCRCLPACFPQALDLKPNYMRAWTNMGISLANLSDYEPSARYYVRALALNPRATAGEHRRGKNGREALTLPLASAACRHEALLCLLNPYSPTLDPGPPTPPPSLPPCLAVWGYLRTSLTCAGRQDLLPSVDSEDLLALQKALPLE